MKKLILLGVLFTLVSSNLFALEITIKGKGGLSFNQTTNTLYVCPEVANTDCATVKIESGEVSVIMNAMEGDQLSLNASGTVDVILEDGSVETYTFSSISSLTVINNTNGEYSGSGCVLTGVSN